MVGVDSAGDDGVVRGGVSLGHCGEQLVGLVRLLVLEVGSDEGVEGGDGSLRHFVEHLAGEIDLAEAGMAGDEVVGRKDRRG